MKKVVLAVLLLGVFQSAQAAIIQIDFDIDFNAYYSSEHLIDSYTTSSNSRNVSDVTPYHDSATRNSMLDNIFSMSVLVDTARAGEVPYPETDTTSYYTYSWGSYSYYTYDYTMILNTDIPYIDTSCNRPYSSYDVCNNLASSGRYSSYYYGSSSSSSLSFGTKRNELKFENKLIYFIVDYLWI